MKIFIPAVLLVSVFLAGILIGHVDAQESKSKLSPTVAHIGLEVQFEGKPWETVLTFPDNGFSTGVIYSEPFLVLPPGVKLRGVRTVEVKD